MKRTFIIGVALAAAAAASLASAGGSASTTRTGTIGVEARLEGFVTDLESEATRVGDATFTERFATEFGVTVDVLTQQRTQFGTDWGDLFLAYSIAEASRTTVTLDEIFQMRESGSTWTQIARSLQVPPGRLMVSVRKRLETLDVEASLGRRSGSGEGNRSGTVRTGKTTGVDRQIDARLETLDDATSRLGDQLTAERLAEEFEVTVDVLNQQRTQFDAEWGELLLAYSIMDRSKTTVTIDEIFALRSSGDSWTEIARSLRIPPGQLLRTLRSETQALAEVDGTATTRTHGKGGGSAMKTTRAGGATKTMKGGSAAKTQVGAAARLSKTTVHGQGALMRATARGATKVHGRK